MGAERVTRRVSSPWRPQEEGAFLLAAVAWGARRLRGPLRVLGVDPVGFHELLRTRVVLTQRATSASSMMRAVVRRFMAPTVTWKP